MSKGKHGQCQISTILELYLTNIMNIRFPVLFVVSNSVLLSKIHIFTFFFALIDRIISIYHVFISGPISTFSTFHQEQ